VVARRSAARAGHRADVVGRRGLTHGTDSSALSRNYRGGRRSADRGGRLAEPAGLTHGTAPPRIRSYRLSSSCWRWSGSTRGWVGEADNSASCSARAGRRKRNPAAPDAKAAAVRTRAGLLATAAARSHLAPAPAIFVTWPEPTPADDDGAPEVEEHLLHLPFWSR
jgi:hypothetical protein